ncbi:hypothetical protein OESDEN_04681 [Oesophagostomum dentatum]|uniref:Transmembrane protein n=1 Tax=Oesophagostomum dentatum TaxID=61180 RepID=A0A0B1TDL6_OESDE|nr:hypothetical protein OESDEN_04681 [Oesophagostomum dentatum]
MYDEEPRVICNLPLSGTVGILSSLVLLTQVLALFLVCSNNFFIYFFELLIAFGMVFFLSQGVRHRKPGHLTIYMAYLAIYVFMMFFIIFGILIGLSFYPSYKRDCDWRITSTPSTPSVTGSTVGHSSTGSTKVMPTRQSDDCVHLTGAFWAEVWSSIALSFLSILLAIIQIRYTLVLYKYIRTRQRQYVCNDWKESERATLNVSYQHFVPGAPPRYTPESPYTLQSSPAQVEAGPLPPKAPVESVATLQPDSLANAPAVSSPTTPAPAHQSLDKGALPPSFLKVESPPEYSETPGPSESSLHTQQHQQSAPPDQVRMEDVPLNDGKVPPHVDLLS